MSLLKFRVTIITTQKPLHVVEYALTETHAREQTVRYLNALGIRRTVKAFNITLLKDILNGPSHPEQPGVCEM